MSCVEPIVIHLPVVGLNLDNSSLSLSDPHHHKYDTLPQFVATPSHSKLSLSAQKIVISMNLEIFAPTEGFTTSFIVTFWFFFFHLSPFSLSPLHLHFAQPKQPFPFRKLVTIFGYTVAGNLRPIRLEQSFQLYAPPCCSITNIQISSNLPTPRCSFVLTYITFETSNRG